jgi:general stress protein 26
VTTAPIRSSQSEAIARAIDVAHRTIWAIMTTVDARGRPRNRVVHPIWIAEGEGVTGWLTTRATPLKTRHLTANPHASFAYIASNHDLAYFDCTAEWLEDPASKQACWDAFLYGPAPVGYDPATIWPDGAGTPSFAALRLHPYRLQGAFAADIAAGQKPLIARF